MRTGETPKPVGGDTFLAYVYKPGWDEFEWREFTRESLMDEVVRHTLTRTYWTGRICLANRADRKASVLAHLRGLLIMGLSPQQARMVREEWAKWWNLNRREVELARRIGHEHARELRGDTLRDMLSAVGA